MNILTSQVENLTDCMEEWAEFNRVHWSNIVMNSDTAPINFDLDLYRSLDSQGFVTFTALRDGPDLVGYFVGFVMSCPHYRIKTCTMDLFYVTPAARSRSGHEMLLRTAKLEIGRLGVRRWFMGEKHHRPEGPLLPSLGFKPIETYHAMALGG